MFDKLEEVVARYDELNKMLVSPEVLADSKKMIECNKALNEITEIVEKYKTDSITVRCSSMFGELFFL